MNHQIETFFAAHEAHEELVKDLEIMTMEFIQQGCCDCAERIKMIINIVKKNG
jgi:hypothetical protein